MKNGRKPGKRSTRAGEMGQVLDELARSGLGVAAFAREHGIPVSTLRWWQSKQRGGVAGNGRRRRGRPPRLVEVIGAAAGASGEGFEVMLRSGRMVRVPMRFEAAALRELLHTLEPPC